MKRIMSVCSYWSKEAHLELDDILGTPFFKAHLNLVSQEYGPSSEAMFRQMLMYEFIA